MEHHITENKENIVKGLIYKFKFFFKKIPQNLADIKNSEFFKNHLILWLLLFNFLTNAANWIALIIFINKTQDNIILHYNVYFGVDNFGNWEQVFWMPGIGLGLFLINFYLAFFFHKNKEVIASYILLIASLMIQLSLIIGVISVILINY